MAQDAELKLKVSLDLAFFRQQISTISTQLAGQGVQLNVQFNKKAIADQYRLLDRYIRGKKFTVELNLVGGLTKNEFDKIKGRLDDLRDLRKVEIPIGIKNGATGKDVDNVVSSIKGRLGNNQQIKQGGGKLRIETSIKPSITNPDIADLKKAAKDKLSKIGALEIATKLETPKVEDLLKALQKNLNRQKPLLVKTSIRPSILRADVRAFKKAIEEKLSGITVKVKAELEGISKQPFSAGPTGLAGLQEYMRSQGMGPTGGAEAKRRAMFEDVVTGATFKELQRMTQQANVTGRSGLKTKAQMQEALLQINDAAMEGILGNLQMRMKDPLPIKRGFLDQIARAVFWMAGVDPEYLRQQAAQRRALPGVNFPATTPSRIISIGPSETGRALPASRAAAGIIGAAQSPVGLLPSITRKSSIQAGIESIFAAGGPRFPEGAPGKLALSTEALQDRVNKQLNEYFKVVEATIKEVFNPQDLKRALNVFSYLPQALRDAETRTRQARIGIPSAQGIAGLLPAATGRAPSAYATGAIGGESREQMMARRTAEAYARSALRGVSVMSERQPALPGTTFMGDAFVSGGGRDRVRGTGQPPQRGGALALAGGPSTHLPDGYFENVKKYNAALEMARAMSERFRASQIPLIGGLREVAGEFGFAVKQVLLFGTAYKGLAFVTSLPGQILNAAKSQQQYNNALQTATQNTGTFAKELLYVDNVQRAFGLNLETTRTGFTRLYASMAPADFDSGSIEKLFTGISAATAALQLTPDKAERVIYAFGQMASKGQIMSEELKGQLGDVLPGALAIFAKAAGMSVKEFSKAMEDGVFVGGKFREVFAKVSDELMTRFGTGAQAAGKSLQGLLNAVGGDFQRTLESFAPLANIAAQAVLGPLGNALRQLSTSAQIAMGEIERVQGQLGTARQDVLSLREGGASASQIRAAEQNVAALEVRYRSLNEALKDPAVAKQVKDLQLLVQELSKAGIFVMNVAKTIGSMLAPALNFLGTNLTSVIATITAFYVGFQAARLAAMALMGVLLLYRGLSALLGFGAAAQQATALAGAFNVLGVAATRATTQMVGLRLALTALVASTVVGAVVAGIVMIAGAFATMGDKARDAAQSSRDAAKAAIDAAKAGNVAGAAMSVQTVLAESRKAAAARKVLQGIYARATPEQKRGAVPMTITPRESVALQGTALTSGMIQAGVSRGGARQIRVPSGLEMRKLTGQFGNLAGQQAIDLREAKEAARQAEEVNKRLGLNKPMPGPAAPEAPSAGGTKEKTKGKDDAKRLAEEIARQAMAASDALFSERQRLLIMQQTNPIAKAFAEYTSQELTIQRELNQALKEAKGDKEKADLRETARLKQSANALELEQEMKRAREDALAPIEDILKGQREQLRYEKDVTDLLQQGMLPERAKQVAEVRKLVRTQLESLDLSIKNARAAITEAEARGASADQIERLKKALEDLEKARGGIEGKGKEAEAGVPPSKEAKSPLDYIKEGAASAQEELAKLTNWGYQAVEAGKAIGSAFGTAFKDLISGSASAQEALASMMQSIADHFLDMAAQIIAQQITMMIYGLILKALGVMGGAVGGGASSNAAGFGGSFDAGIAPLPNVPDYSGAFKFANGGIASGGFIPFRAFANGGMVAGPTLGLVGEGKYNEAIVPLPDGRSIPVQLQDSSIRDKMGGDMAGAGAMPMLSMSFQTTTINGVEYVDRAQLEAAMAETRRISVREGATRGATIALDKLANSPSSRRRVGLR